MNILRKHLYIIIPIIVGIAIALATTACGSKLFQDGGQAAVCHGSQGCYTLSFSPNPTGTQHTTQPASPADTQSSYSALPSPSQEQTTYTSPSPTYASPTPTFSLPPTPSDIPTTSSMDRAQFDSSLHRCKQSSGVNTLISITTQDGAQSLFSCMQIPPEQMNVLIYLTVLAVYDYLTHQPFNPPAQFAGTPQAQYEAPDVVQAYT